MNITDTSRVFLKAIEAPANADGQHAGRLLDHLPEKAEEALNAAWDKFIALVSEYSSAHPGFASGLDASLPFRQALEEKYADIHASFESLETRRENRAETHLGSLIQAIAEFTGARNGIISSSHDAEASCALMTPVNFIAVVGRSE